MTVFDLVEIDAKKGLFHQGHFTLQAANRFPRAWAKDYGSVKVLGKVSVLKAPGKGGTKGTRLSGR